VTISVSLMLNRLYAVLLRSIGYGGVGFMGEILVAAILSVPMSILATVLAPYVQQWLRARGRENDLKRKIRETEAEYELQRIAAPRDNPMEFTQYLVYVGVEIAFISAAIGIFSGLAFVIGQSLNALEGGIGFFYLPDWL